MKLILKSLLSMAVISGAIIPFMVAHNQKHKL